MLVCLKVFYSAENVQEIQSHSPTGKEPRRFMKKNWSTMGVEIRPQLFDRFGELRGGLSSE